MNIQPVFFCILLLLAVSITGCTTPTSPVTNTIEKTADTGGTPPPAASQPAIITPLPYASTNAAVNTSAIPLLLTDTHWQLAGGCGWTADNISESAALLMDNCQVRHLLSDGWEIVGIGYDMNFIGSRCRRSTHPKATDSCDWCLDAGPTLALRYKGIMTTEFLANVKERTVTRFRTNLPEETGSASTGDSDKVVFRNGTVLYTFRNC